MKKTESSVNIYKSWTLISVLAFAVIYFVNGVAILPLLMTLSGNVIFEDGILSFIPTLLDYLRVFLEICAISVSYALMLALLYKKQKIKSVFVIFTCATFLKYLLNVAVSWIFYQSIPMEWHWDLIDVLYYTCLELIQLVIIYLVVKSIIGKFIDKRTAIERTVLKNGVENTYNMDLPCAYPFKSIFDKDNCLLRSVTVCALITFIAKFAGVFLNDVWSIAVGGFPKDAVTWLYMTLNYTSKIIFGLMVYFIVYVVLSSMLKRSEK